jgi:hypothetical protein
MGRRFLPRGHLVEKSRARHLNPPAARRTVPFSLILLGDSVISFSSLQSSPKPSQAERTNERTNENSATDGDGDGQGSYYKHSVTLMAIAHLQTLHSTKHN